MSIQGKNSKSYKKKNVQKQNNPHTGFKNIAFAHQFAAAGETFIPFNSLLTPPAWSESGLVNPTANALLGANLQAFRPNVTVSSSARGLIQKEEYIVHNNRIEFKNIVSLINEVFEVECADIMITGNLIVDTTRIRVEDTLDPGEDEFPIGYEVNTMDEDIIVFRDGQQMFRDDNNAGDNSGNYYYIDPTNSGKSSLIKFNIPAGLVADAILVVSIGHIVDAPNVSTFAQIDYLAGQLDAIVPTVAANAGVPESNFRANPNRIDLRQFGERLIRIEADAGKLGDVKTSMLTEAQFQSLHDPSWVLMDGRSVVGSDYETLTGDSVIADARGQFLRAASADASVDPEGPRNPGDTQDDATAVNGLSASTSIANDTHDHNLNYISPSQYFYSGVNNGYSPGPGGTGNTLDVIDNDTHNHGATTTVSSTDAETRPTNLAVNYFIKINV